MDPKDRIERAIGAQVQKAMALVDYHDSLTNKAIIKKARWNGYWSMVTSFINRVSDGIDSWFHNKSIKAADVVSEHMEQYDETYEWAHELRRRHGY